MPDVVNVNNDLGWKNTATRLATLGFGAAFEDVDDDTDRNTLRDVDTIEQNLKPEDYMKSQDLFGTYYNMFVGGVTQAHRLAVRAQAKKQRTWADATMDRFYDEADRLDAETNRELKKQLCILRNQLNTVGGTTRSYMTGKLQGELIVDTQTQLNAQKLANYQQAEQQAEQAIARASQFMHVAYNEADQMDYQKLTGILQIMRGSWTRNDTAEETRDRIERDIATKRITADYERSVGSTSESSGTYDSDYSDVLAAGQAVIAQFPTGV